MWVVLRSEIPSGICAKLRTVAASNNKVHMPWSLSAYASRYVQSFTSSVSPKITRHDHSIIACSRHIYLWCCSSRTSRSWWITQSTQHHRRGCNSSNASFEWLDFDVSLTQQNLWLRPPFMLNAQAYHVVVKASIVMSQKPHKCTAKV